MTMAVVLLYRFFWRLGNASHRGDCRVVAEFDNWDLEKMLLSLRMLTG